MTGQIEHSMNNLPDQNRHSYSGVRDERGKDLQELGLRMVIITGVALTALDIAPHYGRHPDTSWFFTGVFVLIAGVLIYLVGLIGPRFHQLTSHPIEAYKKFRAPHEETMKEFLERGGPEVDEYHRNAIENVIRMAPRMPGRIPPVGHPTSSEIMRPTASRCGLCNSPLSRRADGSLWCPKHSPTAGR